MYQKLFTPIKIRGMELKNRIILPAMGTRMADERSMVTQRLIDYHAARARGGCALNIVEVSSVHTPSAPAHFVSISEDGHIEGHKRLTGAIHREGGKAGIQLWQGSIAVTFDPKARVFVTSDMPFGGFTLPGITKEEIGEITACYGKAAKRCVEAGYDCIEFHCAHNYLPHSFLSKGLNHREDEYGGSFGHRARFPLECIRAIRAAMPDAMPLLMRIDAMDDCLPEGLTIEDVIRFCKLAGEAGADVLDVSRGNIITEAAIYEVPPIDIPNGFNVDNAARIRKETGMLTIAVGRINTPRLAEQILKEDKADLIVVGRAQLADPEFCKKAEEGREEEIVGCVGCNQGCYDGFCDVQNRPFITCLRNPAIGHEAEYVLEKAEKEKLVWIAGGGVAGLEAAQVLRKRGHRPVIFEAGDHLGGQFITAGMAPGKQEMSEAARAFAEQVARSGTEIHLNQALTGAMLEAGKPDEVILAIGSSPVELKLPGSEKKKVCTAHSVLNGLERIKGSTVVVGGGLVGLEAADYIAGAGDAVTVVEMLEKAGRDLGSLRYIAVMQKMRQLAVVIMENARCIAVSDEGVIVQRDGKKETIACDNVVIAIGAKPNSSVELERMCNALGIPYHTIGDAKEARRALDAIHEAFDAARKI